MLAFLAGGKITIGDHRGVVHIPGLGTVDLDVGHRPSLPS